MWVNIVELPRKTEGQLDPSTPVPATLPLPDESQGGRGPWRAPWATPLPHNPMGLC